MTVPGWMFWFTYIGVPIMAGIMAVRSAMLAKRGQSRTQRLARYEKRIGSAMLVCGAINTFEFVRMTPEMNLFGLVLYFVILGTQFGLGFLFRSDPKRNPAARAPLGFLAIATAVTMLVVRAQIVWIFG